jgi:hypothetical protein
MIKACHDAITTCLLSPIMLSVLYALAVFVVGVDCRVTSSLQSRANLPAPLSITPSENWEGIDGIWNTFTLRIGSPAQVVRVLVSTTSQQVWTIDSQACASASDFNSCAQSRGGLFQSNKSKTWQEDGIYELFIEKNLNLSGASVFGFDDVGLGYVGQNGPVLQHQIVGSVAVNSFWFGHLGLQPKTTNFTDLAQNIPSYMSTLRSKNMIPSVSWGYTQGAPYSKFRLICYLVLAKITQDSLEFKHL